MLISLTKHVLSFIKAYFWCTTHAHNFPCTLVHCEEEGSSFWTEGLVLLHRSIQSLQKKPIELFTMIDKQVLQLNISCWHRYQHEGVIDVEGKPKNIVPGWKKPSCTCSHTFLQLSHWRCSAEKQVDCSLCNLDTQRAMTTHF